MEIRIYRSYEHYQGSKPFYVAKVENVDVFSFSEAMKVFRAIYGSQIIIVFICV